MLHRRPTQCKQRRDVGGNTPPTGVAFVVFVVFFEPPTAAARETHRMSACGCASPSSPRGKRAGEVHLRLQGVAPSRTGPAHHCRRAHRAEWPSRQCAETHRGVREAHAGSRVAVAGVPAELDAVLLALHRPRPLRRRVCSAGSSGAVAPVDEW